MIFSKNHDFPEILENTTFLTFESEKVLENDFFDRNLNFPEKYGTSAPDWYIYFGRTPRSSRDLMLQTLMYTSHDFLRWVRIHDKYWIIFFRNRKTFLLSKLFMHRLLQDTEEVFR